MLRIKFVNSGQATKAIVATCKGCHKPLVRSDTRGHLCPMCIKNNRTAGTRS